MDQDGILMADLVLELTDGLQKGLALDIAYGAADFNDGNLRVFGSEVAVKTALYFIGNVGDNLDRTAAEVAAPLLLKHAPVDFTGGDVRIFRETFINESFVVT